MADIRKELHDEIDLMSEYEMVKLKELLDTFPSKPHVAYRRAPLDDEPITEEDQAAIDESHEDVKHGRVISHEELMRELGLK